MPLMRKHYDTPEALEQAFYEALEHADLDGLMALWSDDDEIIYIPPGGTRLVGHSAVRSAWRETFANGPVHVRPTQPHVIQNATIALHSVIEEVMINHAGKTTLVHLLASNIYFKGPNGWRLIMHHASPSVDQNAPRQTAMVEGYLH